MTKRILIPTYLDRTLLPNGKRPESPGAQVAFTGLVSSPEVTLAYVSGRHRSLVEDAIRKYELLLPDWVIDDSGNDLPVLAGTVLLVLVANADSEVVEQAKTQALQQGTMTSLYLAQGGFLGINGFYSAGILEGVSHFFPFTRCWM